jgi:predicted dehydrogenase
MFALACLQIREIGMTVQWGVLGASRFAQDNMAPAIHAAKGANLAALATSSVEKAAGFQAFAPDIKVHLDYDALLADPSIDAIYIPLPNHLHVPWTIKALQAGKHVLCEKPIALNAEAFDDLIAARDASGLIAAEAFMIVHHSQFFRARELVQSGAIGELVHIDGTFSYNNAGDVTNIRHDPTKGGGALPDIGVYPIGAARFVSGLEPAAVTLSNLRYEHGVDVFSQVAADFGAASFSAIVSMRMMNYQQITFHGTTGILRLTCPFNANKADVAELILDRKGAPRSTERWPAENHYVGQVENFCASVRGEAVFPCSLEWSKGTQVMLDMIYAAAQ